MQRSFKIQTQLDLEQMDVAKQRKTSHSEGMPTLPDVLPFRVSMLEIDPVGLQLLVTTNL